MTGQVDLRGLAVSRSLRSRRHVTRVGCGVARGGTMTRNPEKRVPHTTPPRASTIKLTRNLRNTK